MIYFTLPNFYYYREINNYLKRLAKHHPEYFLYNMKIYGEEGSFAFHYFNGNGLNTTYPYFRKEICDYYTIQKEHELHYFETLILDCSNIYLNEKDLNDTVENLTLQLMQNGDNKVLVSNNTVKNYIKNNFPQYEILASEFYDGNLDDILRKRYFYFNIDYSLPKNKVEVILTTPCQCEKYLECKKINHKKQYNYQQNSVFNDCNLHKIKKYHFDRDLIKNLIEQGYRYFSFDLNNFNINDCEDILYFYLEFFIKEEYQSDAQLFLRGLKTI